LAKRLLIPCFVVACTAAACISASRQPPVTALPARLDPSESSRRTPPGPLHKGHVDISTGLYIREDDDLVVPSPLPIVLRRTYLSGDRKSRHFGVGTTHPGEWYLYGDGDQRVPWAELILADGGRIHFDRISSGTSQVDAVLRHDSTPGVFNGALLAWDGLRWALRFRAGASALSQDCISGDDVCSLLEQRDSSGHRIVYVRAASGTLVKMESAGQAVTLDYDDHHRIVRAGDTSQHSVSYTYDDAGRLTRATASDGTVRVYTYNARDEMIAVREPGRIVENSFDESGRLIKQVVHLPRYDEPYVMTFSYVVAGGSVTQTDVGEDDGTRTTYRFNKSHYPVSETHDADGCAPITVVYNRNESTSVATTITLSCLGPTGPVTRTVPLPARFDDLVKEDLIREECSAHLR